MREIYDHLISGAIHEIKNESIKNGLEISLLL
jgi:hypothetical protein